MFTLLRLFGSVCILSWCWAASFAAELAKVDYLRDVAPILSRCSSCHGLEKQESELNLQAKASALKGSENGPVIVPGKSGESLLIKLVSGAEMDRLMPPAGEGQPLNAEQIATLKDWIDQGAAWPDSADGSGGNHWAYKKPLRPELPPVQNAAWCRTPLDRFVLARLEQEKLSPAAELDRTRWLRRASLDLIGLPPTPEEVDAFVNDTAADANEKVVDRLLASPQYGERWARPWLDLARYADTNGYEKDPRRSMWPYRDWVIGALNRDLPFDQFTIEQLAGDLLANPTREQLVATGFHRNTMINTEGGVDGEEYRNVAVVDRVNTTAAVWLATTLNCAQCHTHKYDPIKQAEYYQIFAFYNSNADSATAENVILELPSPAQEAALAEVAAYEKAAGQTPELKEVRDKIAAAKKQIQDQIPKTFVMQELEQPRETKIHIRGNFLSLGEPVSPGVPAVLHPLRDDAQPRNRLALAKWLVDRDNPLTARVMVNRIWEQYFGRGLVGTSEDFGVRGEVPAHPELLDWLAVEFMDQGWSLKKLHRLIVLSAVYRQNARLTPELRERDPENRLLARGPRNRLEAELVRDQALAVAGLLSKKMGGPSVMPPQPPGIWNSPYNGEQWAVSDGEDKFRRGIYTFWKRTSPYPAFMTFDAPSREFCVVRRTRSNTPLQALTTLNDPVYIEAAQALAKRMLREAPDESARIARGFRLVLARQPDEAETARLAALLKSERDHFAATSASAEKLAGPLEKGATAVEQAAYVTLANVLLNLDEALTR